MVAALGVRDLVIVETDDAVLVADKSRSQEVKEVVETLARQARTEPSHTAGSIGPGAITRASMQAKRFQVKRIMVKPGDASRYRCITIGRSTGWWFGTAQVTRGDEVKLLSENESIYIPIGTSIDSKTWGRCRFSS